MICIWCKQEFAKLSLEHGIPEGLACPPELEMDDVACAGCNNGLSRIDRALIKQFETITVMYGVPRKKGRAPMINSGSRFAASSARTGRTSMSMRVRASSRPTASRCIRRRRRTESPMCG
jgi:hypothetical protein